MVPKKIMTCSTFNDCVGGESCGGALLLNSVVDNLEEKKKVRKSEKEKYHIKVAM